jgi:hypothetical protein
MERRRFMREFKLDSLIKSIDRDSVARALEAAEYPEVNKSRLS